MKKNNMKLLAANLIAVLIALVASNAVAGPILGVSSISSDTPVFANYYSLDNAINQSGLSVGYTSGLTDFDTYFSSNPYHDNYASTSVALKRGVSNASILLDLGGVYTIESFALWNRYYSNQGVSGFKLFASNDSAFTNEIFLGGFNAQTGLGEENKVLAEIFEFNAVSAAFVKMDITGYYGNVAISFKELAFEQAAPVPEPSTWLLLVFGLTGVGFYVRKNSKN